jgi:hypothetical protein
MPAFARALQKWLFAILYHWLIPEVRLWRNASLGSVVWLIT